MARIRGVLLDIDGTLLDSNRAHARAFVDAFAERGVDVPLAKVERLIGMGGDKLVEAAAGVSAESDDGKAVRKRKKALFRERYVDTLGPTPGARALLERLRALGQKLVVATSAEGDELDALLDRAGVRDLIEASATSSDAEESKPDPDIVEAAAKRARLPARELIMLGDTPYDVEAAQRASVAIVALRCGGWDTQALRGAAAVFDDPAALLAALDTLPFTFEGAR